MQLKIGTKTFDRFTKVPIPLTVKFYLFNVTNSEQVLAGLERPIFQEVGPFMYKQWRRREIVDFEDYNRRLRYREIKTFYPMYTPKPNDLTSDIDFDNINNNSNNNPRIRHNNDNNYNNITNNTPKIRLDSNNNKHNDIKTAQQPQLTLTKQQQQQTLQIEPGYLDPHDFNVTIINVPLLSVLTKLANIEEGSFKRNLAARIASRLIADRNDKILITKTASQLLFEGYRVDFMESARDLVCDILGFNFDSPLPGNKFGFFYGKNGTWNKRENGELTVFTGRNDSMDDFMLVDNWNDQRQLNVWPTNTVAGNRCNQIRGTDGSQFHPGVTREQVLQIFSPMVCTSLFIKYKEDTSCRDIPLLRFTTPPEIFGAPKKNPKNACYCTIPSTATAAGSNSLGGTQSLTGSSSGKYGQQLNNNHRQPIASSANTITTTSTTTTTTSSLGQQKGGGIDDSRCYLDGLMDLSLCQRGAPIAASSPHFYNGDPMLAMAAGMKPQKEMHETYIDIEPMTGAVMRAASRAQLNAFVERAALEVVDPNLIGHMAPMVAPLLWLEEAAEIDEKSSREFKGQLLSVVQKARRSFIIAILLGIILVVGTTLQYWYVACYLPDHEDKIKKSHNNNKSTGGEYDLKSGKPTGGGSRSALRSARDGDRIRDKDRRRLLVEASEKSVKEGRQLRDNLVFSSDARKSNLAAKRGLVNSLSPSERREPEVVGKSSLSLAKTAVEVGAVFGAASAGGAGRRNEQRRHERAQQAQFPNDFEGADEEETSKRPLVDWDPLQAEPGTSGTSSGHSSQLGVSPATAGRDDDDDDSDSSST